MAALDCTREADVIDAITSHRWPAKVDAELQEHVAACAVCADVAEVVTALHAEQQTTWTDTASLPSAQVVWFRAQARARAEATREASRPIAMMQALGFACAAAVVSGLIGVVAFRVWSRTDLLAALPAIPVAGPDAIGMVIRGTLLAIGIWLVLAPFAVYLVASDD